MKNFIYTPRLARPDIALTDWSLLKIEEFFSGLKGINVAGVRDVVSGSFSAVLDFYDQIGRRAAGVFNDGVIDRKVSAQLLLGGVLSTSHQVPSGVPKRNGGHGENDGKGGDNGFAVGVDELPGAAPLPRQEGREAGYTIFRILSAALIWYGAYAMLKRFGKRDDAHTKGDKKQPQSDRAHR